MSGQEKLEANLRKNLVTVEEIQAICDTMDDADVPAGDRFVIVTSEGFERTLYAQAPWWKKLLFKIFPKVLSHAWITNPHRTSMEWRDGKLFNYLVCLKCGMTTDHFDISSASEFDRHQGICGCLK